MTTGEPARVDGPLAGVRVLELAGKGAAAYCAMLLADMGAEVLRVDRPEHVRAAADAPRGAPPRDLRRGRRSAGIDLKHPDGTAFVLELVARADVVMEGYRPGVAERLGLGPDACRAVKPDVVYGRVTGWGNAGPYANRVGHDIDYIAVTGLLDAVGPPDHPVPPLNLAGDGAGGMIAAFGIVCALHQSRTTGVGVTVDSAMIDAAHSLMTGFHLRAPIGQWTERRQANKIDGGAPFYNVYETLDGRHVAVGAIEPHFYAALLALCGLDADELPEQWDEAEWPAMRARFAAVFNTRTRDRWVSDAAGTDSCLAPVLTLSEAPDDAHNAARGTFVEVDGVTQPAPVPRFGPEPVTVRRGAARDGQHTREVLSDWGVSNERLGDLIERGIVVELDRPAMAAG